MSRSLERRLGEAATKGGNSTLSATQSVKQFMVPSESKILTADQGLVQAVLAKDRKATAEFVDQHIDAVFAYVRRRLAPNYEPADDLVQDIFLESWEALRNFRGQSSVRTWILGIARHKVQDYYRSRLRTFVDIEDSSAVVPAGFDLAHEQQNESARVAFVLTQLPEHYRLALRWRYWEQWSAEEMALQTGKTEKAVERLLSRAREQFRRCYGG